MTYEKYPNSETNGNPQYAPLFILTRQMMRAIHDGPLTVSAIDDLVRASMYRGEWREQSLALLKPEEKIHLAHVQTVLPAEYNSPLQTLMIMYCFG